MSNGFKDWLLGVMIFIIITWIAYTINVFIFPSSHYNFLEWFAIIMICVVAKTGLDSWNSEE